MDTFKDRQQLDDLYNRGEAPWEVWKSARNGATEITCRHHRQGHA